MVIKPNSITNSSQVNVTDREIIVLILEFLESKNLHISQVTLERETGLVNGHFSEEVLFLRNLIIEGLWDDAVDYVEPLTQAPNFDYNLFKKILFKFKYLELLCIKNEIGNTKFSDSVAVNCLRDLEVLCEKSEFNEYRLLLSYPRIQDHPEYHDWNPSSGRIKCFNEIRGLVETVLRNEGNQPVDTPQSPPHRLVNLLIKGILYETAGRLCHQRAKKTSDDLRFTSLLPKSCMNADMTLLSWLQVIPVETFGCQFEEKNLPLNYQKMEKPLLEATWTELIQQSPIRTRGGKQEESAATSRVAVSDRMVQSMVEQMDGFRRKSFGAGSNSARQRVLSQSFHLGGLGHEDMTLSGVFSGSSPRGSPFRSARASLSKIPEDPDGAGDGKATIPSEKSVSPSSQENSSFDSDGKESVGRNQIDSERRQLQDEWQERDRQRDLLMAQILQPATPANTSRISTFEPVSPLIYQTDNSFSPPADYSRVSVKESPPRSAEKVPEVNFTPERSAVGKPVAALNGLNSGISSAQGSSRAGSSPDSILPHGGLQSGGGGFPDSGERIFMAQQDASQRFVPVQIVEDCMFVRCAAFHPSGDFYAIGSNSRMLRICSYPRPLRVRSLRSEHPTQAPVVDSRVGYHKSSIFCIAWSPKGDLLATGSNDRLIKLSRFDQETHQLQDTNNFELKIHDETIRDITFMHGRSGECWMVSGGADNKICITDCRTATAFQKFSDHTGPVLSLHTWGGPLIVSGSQDRSCRIWDTRSLQSAKVINQENGAPAAAVTCVRVDLSGKVLISSYENGEVMIWDLRGERPIQVMKAHDKEIRGISISPRSTMLLTASYDKTVVAHSMEGNLFEPLPAVVAAVHADKVIQCHIHPQDVSFLTTSADKTCVLWGCPDILQ